MIHHNSTQGSAQGSAQTVNRAIASLFVAGITFVFGYTLVRAALGPAQAAPVQGTEAATVIPHEATLWAGFIDK
jgi:hypothetical protein